MTPAEGGLREVDLHRLAEGSDGWISFPVPGGSEPVRLHRLHADAVTKASVSLVEFPPGWAREETGSYVVAEEFVLLRGRLELNGRSHVAGDWVLVPAGARRTGTRAGEGALALAWFGGVPTWRSGEHDESADVLTAGAEALGVLLEPTGPHGGTEAVLGPVRQAGGSRDALDPETGRWLWLPRGSSVPDEGRWIVRSW